MAVSTTSTTRVAGLPFVDVVVLSASTFFAFFFFLLSPDPDPSVANLEAIVLSLAFSLPLLLVPSDFVFDLTGFEKIESISVAMSAVGSFGEFPWVFEGFVLSLEVDA